MGGPNKTFVARDRTGRSMVWTLGVLVLAGAVGIGAIVWFSLPGSDDAGASPAIVHKVGAGYFEHFVIERGDLESSNNEEIRCQVRARTGGPGTPILKIVPAGVYVRKGDFLIQFDDSALQSALVSQRILAANAKATKIQSETAVKTAAAALAEYINGLSKQEQELARGEVFVAQENLRRAEEVLRFTERLAGRNYVTPVQLDADRFAVKKAAQDLKAAQTKVEVLQTHTYQKMIAQLEGEISKAEALLQASIASDDLESRTLADIEDQIAKCRVVAPADGQVVYATQNDRRGDEQVVIEEGAVIREGQTVIRLPDTKRMQVKALVNESRINLVRAGAEAKIELDANPGVELDGVVEQIDAFPMNRRWSSSVKEYGAIVKILTPTENLRPGLRAKIRVFIHGEDDVLQVPVQAVVERGGQHFCMTQSGDQWVSKKVTLGANNDKFVIIRSGLAAGDQVAVDPKPFLAAAGLTEAPDPGSKLAGGKGGRREGGRRGPRPAVETQRAETGGGG
jgi:multidrug resistance efflux pump